MKYRWTLAALAAMVGSSFHFGLVNAQETKKARVVIVEENDDDAEPTTSKQEGKKVETRSNVIMLKSDGKNPDEILAMVEKQLANSGLEEAKLKELVAKLRSQLEAKSADGEKPHKMEIQVHAAEVEGKPKVAAFDVKMDGEAIVIDKEGKQQRIVLNGVDLISPKSGAMNSQSGQKAYRFEWAGGGSPDEQHEKILEALKKHGVADEAIQGVMKSLGSLGRLGNVGVTMDHEGGEEERFVIGVALQSEVTSTEDGDEEKKEGKLLVTEVFEGSPAGQAGLREGDAIVSTNGETIIELPKLIERIQEAGKGDKAISFTIQRDGETKTITVKPKMEKISTAVGLSTQLQEALGKLPKQMERGFVFEGEGRAKGIPLPMWTSAGEDMKELKSELDSVKKELKEIKEMLKALKKD